MLKALSLIFDPVNAWEKIEQAQNKVSTVLCQFLLPLVLLTSVAEGLLLMRVGQPRGSVVERVVRLPQDLVLRYELTQFALTLAVAFGGGWLFQKIGEGFHRAHTFTQSFTTLAYALGPLLLLRVLDGVPGINTWICWGIGVFLSLSALYRGVPRIMKPDPSNALGLYLISCLLFLAVTGLAHFVAVLVLEEKLLT